jgi:hypothetical protein
MWARIKAAGWVVTLGAVLSAIVLGLAAAKSVNKQSSAKRKEAQAVGKMNSGISSEIHKGKRLLEAANKDKDAAVAADVKMENQLEKMGAANESLDAIAHRFNSRRLRKSAGSEPT